MMYIIIIVTCILILLFLKIVLGFNIKEIKNLAENKELDNLTNTYPENMEVAKSMLKMLENETVNLEEDKETKTCLYLVQGNKIIIANISDTFSRIQTIAHECLHSVQNKNTLWAQYIISNIYLIYFGIVSILTIFHIIKNSIIYLVILSVIGVIQYILKSYLETDAMTKAKYLAKDYLEENNIGTKEERNKLIKAYDELNKLGVPATNYSLIRSAVVKIIIYCSIAQIISFFYIK